MEPPDHIDHTCDTITNQNLGNAFDQSTLMQKQGNAAGYHDQAHSISLFQAIS